jgi:rod shape-determining protein MreC
MSRTVRYLLFLCIGSALLYVSDLYALSGVAAAVRSEIVAPTMTNGSSRLRDAASFLGSLASFRSLVDDQAALLRERDFYRGEYFRLRAVDEENALLREVVVTGEESGGEHLILSSIVRDPLRPHEYVQIDAGQEQGVREGNAVITGERVYIGKVTVLGARSSTVELVTAASARTAALLARSSTNVLVRGSATGALHLELVPKEVDVAEGEVVITSGLRDEIPRNLVIGEVERVTRDDSASFNGGIIDSFFSIEDVTTVFVVSQ